MGSPFTGRVLDRVLNLIDPASPVGQRLWGAKAQHGDAFPLRLAGALHALARAGDTDLAPAYPPHEPRDAALTTALRRVLHRRAVDILPWLDHPPQTNEVARSAVLIATGHWLTARFGLPLVLSELGASAGLNLLWDQYGLIAGSQTYGPPSPALTLSPDWRGATPPLARPEVTERAGVDLAPIDPVTGRARLLAYIWADQAARLARCQAAMDLAQRLELRVSQGDAGDWAASRLDQAHPGRLHLIYHTVAAQYFPAATAQKLDAALQKAGGRATARAPLAHLAMEADGGTGAALTLTLWPGGQVIPLGRADFHGRWVNWQAPTL